MCFVFLAIGGGIGAAYAAGIRLPTATPTPPVAAAAPVAPSAEVPTVVAPTEPLEVRVRAVPASAELMLDGSSVGHGTYSASLVRDGIPHVLEVRAEGYIPHRIEFLDVAPVATIELERIPHHHRGPVEARSSRMTETGLVEATTAVAIPTQPPPQEHGGAGASTQSMPVIGGGTGHTGAQSPPTTPTPAPTPEATPEPTPEAPPAPTPPPPAHDDDDWGGPTQDLQPFE